MGKTRYNVASTERVKSTPTQTCTFVPDHSPASIVGRLPAHPARLHVGIVRAARPRRHAARPHDRPARRPGHDSLWRGHALAHALTPRCDASTREHTCHSAAFHRIQCPGRCLRMSTAPNNTSIQPRLNWLGIITAGTRWTTTSTPSRGCTCTRRRQRSTLWADTCASPARCSTAPASSLSERSSFASPRERCPKTGVCWSNKAAQALTRRLAL